MSWRSYNAPYGLAQLAQRMGVPVSDLVNDPTLVASAAGALEGGSQADKAAVAQAFMANYDKGGSTPAALLKSIGGIDSLVMPTRRRIGPLSINANQTLRQLNQTDLDRNDDYLEDLKTGDTTPVIPLDYTQNFSPSAAMVQPTHGWKTFIGPKGAIYGPSWSRKQIQSGDVAKVGSEYFSRDENNQPFQVSWTGRDTGAYAGPEGEGEGAYKAAEADTRPDILKTDFGRETPERMHFVAPPGTPGAAAFAAAVSDPQTAVALNTPATDTPPTDISTKGLGMQGAFSPMNLAKAGLGVAAQAFGGGGDDGSAKQAKDDMERAEKSNASMLALGDQDQARARQILDAYIKRQKPTPSPIGSTV